MICNKSTRLLFSTIGPRLNYCHHETIMKHKVTKIIKNETQILIVKRRSWKWYNFTILHNCSFKWFNMVGKKDVRERSKMKRDYMFGQEKKRLLLKGKRVQKSFTAT